MNKKKLLLHVCCGPCSTYCVSELMKDYEVTMFFYNPNIHPSGEHTKRFENARKVSKELNIPMIEGAYSPEEWLKMITGYEEEPEGGKRCKICFSIRLAESARYAKEHGFQCFTTTMTISPHKDSDVINRLGEHLAGQHKLEWVTSDFKQNDGFKKSIEMSKKMELYRQKYCGCFYSVNNNIASPKE